MQRRYSRRTAIRIYFQRDKFSAPPTVIIGGSCHKYHFCRDKGTLVATKLLSRHWRELPQVKILACGYLNHKSWAEGPGGGGGRLYTNHYTVTIRMTHALRQAAMTAIHFNVSLIVRDKVTRQCPQTTTFEEKGNRSGFEQRPFRLPALPLGHTGSHPTMTG